MEVLYLSVNSDNDAGRKTRILPAICQKENPQMNYSK